jgi:general secretion pathway protein J
MTEGQRAGEAGFTLVELLVAVVLVTLLTALLFGGLRSAAQAWSKVDRQVDAAADFEAARTLLRRAVLSAYPAFAGTDPADRTIAFDGAGDELTVVAPLPAAIAAGVEARQRFYVAAAGGAHALYMAWQLDLPAADPAAAPEHRVRLLDHVGALRFQYYGAPERGQAPTWLESWKGFAHLPELVRVHIEREGPAGAAWPDLLVETKTSMNTACIYDAVAAACRRVR